MVLVSRFISWCDMFDVKWFDRLARRIRSVSFQCTNHKLDKFTRRDTAENWNSKLRLQKCFCQQTILDSLIPLLSTNATTPSSQGEDDMALTVQQWGDGVCYLEATLQKTDLKQVCWLSWMLLGELLLPAETRHQQFYCISAKIHWWRTLMVGCENVLLQPRDRVSNAEHHPQSLLSFHFKPVQCPFQHQQPKRRSPNQS